MGNLIIQWFRINGTNTITDNSYIITVNFPIKFNSGWENVYTSIYTDKNLGNYSKVVVWADRINTNQTSCIIKSTIMSLTVTAIAIGY